MRNLAKHAAQICGIYAAYAAYFSAYFRYMQFRVTENYNHYH